MKTWGGCRNTGVRLRQSDSGLPLWDALRLVVVVGVSRWDSRTIGGDSEPVWERSTALLKLRIPSRSLGGSRVGVVGQQQR